MGGQTSKPTPPICEKGCVSQDKAIGSPATVGLRIQPSATNKLEGTLDSEAFTRWEQAVCGNPTKRLARTILSQQDIWKTLKSPKTMLADQHVFNLTLSHKAGKITDQKKTGRCWIFATLNIARMAAMEKHGLDTLELSQSYLTFYNWLEKSNYFLEQMIDLAAEPWENDTIQKLCGYMQVDGGQFALAVNLIEKYGIVPQSIYPESYNSTYSVDFDKLLASKLREYATELRNLHRHALTTSGEANFSQSADQRNLLAVQIARQRKEEQMSEVYTMLSIAFGTPPRRDEQFTWDFYDRNSKYQSITSTPLRFYHQSCAPYKASHCISVMNDPRREYGRLYAAARLGNMFGGRPVQHVNMTAEYLMKITIDSLKADQPVWLGCDVFQFSDTELGVMDTDLYDLQTPFGIKLGMDKAQRLRTGDSSNCHAMVITGAHISPSGEPVRSKVENSWSDKVGSRGWFVMTSSWFKEYVYQIAVDRKYLSKEVQCTWDQGESESVPLGDPI